MKITGLVCSLIVTACVLGGLAVAVALEESPVNQSQRGQFQKAHNDRNYKDAYEGFRKLALDPEDDPLLVGEDLNMAISCLEQLNRVDEIDAFREAVIKTHAENWRLLSAAAQSYMNVQHQGFMVAGKFERGPQSGRRPGGQRRRARPGPRPATDGPGDARWPRPTTNRCRGRRLLPRVRRNALGRARLRPRRGGCRSLTDLGVLPDYEPGWGGYYGRPRGAPVDDRGQAGLLPRAQELRGGQPATASAGGGAWPRRSRSTPSRRNRGPTCSSPTSCASQFGVQTMAEYGWRFGRMETDDSEGRRERHLRPAHARRGRDDRPAGHRHQAVQAARRVQLHQDLPATWRPTARRSPARAWRPCSSLAEIFENRRQYPRAAEYCRQCVEIYREAKNTDAANGWQARLDQIVGNWGRFEPVADAAGRQGRDGRVPLPQRPRGQVHRPRDPHRQAAGRREGLSEVATPASSTGQKMNIGNIGYRLVEQNEKQYRRPRGGLVGTGPGAPREALRQAGHRHHAAAEGRAPICVTAEMADGNTSQIVLWLADTAIVKKPLAEQGPTTSWPTPSRASRSPRPTSSSSAISRSRPPTTAFQVDVSQFAEYTDADGQVMTDAEAAADQLPVAHHRPDDARAASPTSASPASGTAATTTRSTTRPRSSRSPTGRSIGRSRRCTTSSGSATRKYDSPTRPTFAGADVHRRDPQPQGREGRREVAHGRRVRRHRGHARTAGGRRAGRVPTGGHATARPAWAAAASASRSTRSPSSR